MWHHGQGRGTEYCDGCKAAGTPCATDSPSLCQYNALAPKSDEGRAAWAAFQEDSWRIKVVGMGVIIGIDTSRALRRLIANGVDPEIAEDLLAACERGCVAALNEKQDGDEQD